MSAFRRLLLAAALFAAGFTAAPLALAQPASSHDMPHSMRVHARGDHGGPARFIEGRLAFLQTELKLTPEQQPLFDQLADEMRATAQTMQARHAERKAETDKDKPASALERLERRNAMMKEASAAGERFLQAFKPLYESLSDEQKKTADQLFSRHGGRHMGMKHH